MNLAEPLRTAIIGSSAITDLLAVYNSAPAVFTRRPTPTDVTFPVVVTSPDIAINERDFIAGEAVDVVRDITAYALNDTAESYRAVETIAYAVRDLFHRRRSVIAVLGWSVVDIVARGPTPAPTDDDTQVARRVELTVLLAKL